MTVQEPAIASVLERWRRCLPGADWYLRLETDLRRYFFGSPRSQHEREVRWAIYDLVAEELERGGIGLGEQGIDWDADRKAVRFAVVHHSGTLPDVSASRLSAMGLLRLYAPVYLNSKEYPDAYGRPIHSHHWKRRQVFYSYHWLVRPDGTQERLLDDRHIGWHAGNWEINCASVGVCLAGDYSKGPPPEPAARSLRELLRSYSGAEVLLHSTVNSKIDCPGEWARGRAWA